VFRVFNILPLNHQLQLAAKVKELGYKPIVDFVCGEIYFKNTKD
jgi:hypothetical protein